MPYDSLVKGHCAACPAPIADKGSGLCQAHAIQLTHNMLNSEPDPVLKHCAVCGNTFRYTEARVLRLAQDPDAKNPSRVTPLLCWVCVRLHNSAGFSMERDLKAC